jgi:hypothetical protein
MPKDPKRNIQSYQLEGGNLNQFEFQKNQSQMAEDSEVPFTDETEPPNLAQATKRVAQVAADAHRIVEKRRKRGLVKAGAQQRSATGKRSAKKVARKTPKKTAKRAAVKKRTGVKAKKQKAAR